MTTTSEQQNAPLTAHVHTSQHGMYAFCAVTNTSELSAGQPNVSIAQPRFTVAPMPLPYRQVNVPGPTPRMISFAQDDVSRTDQLYTAQHGTYIPCAAAISSPMSWGQAGNPNAQPRFTAAPMPPHLTPTYLQTRQTAVGKHSIPEMSTVLPDFDPCSDECTSIQFIERIDQLKAIYEWEDSLLTFAVLGKLKGAARRWAGVQPVFRKWSDFVTAFLEDFPHIHNAADAHMRLMSTKMEPREKIVDYYYRVLAIGRRENIEDRSIIRYMINGLTDENLRKTLSTLHFSKCSDLLQSMLHVSVTPSKSNMSNFHFRHSEPEFKTLRTSGVGGAVAANKEKTGPVCYNCRDRGHLSRNCPRPQKRESVRPGGKINLITVDDVEESRSEDIDIEVNNIKHEGKGHELLKQVSFIGKNRVTCKALIDSGSSKTLVKRMIAQKCVGDIIACCERLVGFAGGEIVCHEKLLAKIQFDETVYQGELLIVENETMKHDALIGVDVLSKGKVIIENGNCQVMAISSRDLDIGEGLEDDTKQRLFGLLTSYVKCFGEKLHELGRSQRFKMDITVTSPKPIVRKPYAIPIPKERVVEEIIAELLELDIIRPSKSLYASPIVLVRKQNGGDRLCVDFRALNAITEKQPWLMPTVDGVLSTLSGKKCFTTLDLMSGYYQIELEESSKHFTAFVTHQGHYEFNRMPFGLRNAPCVFQRMMSELIMPLRKKVVSYVDEVIIATETEDENLVILEELLKILKQEGLTLRLSKCTLLKSVVSFLGHEVDAEGVRPGASKTLAIKNYPTPINQMEVRRFLGLTGFFRKFVHGYAIIAQPLTELTKGDVTFAWTARCEKAFQQIIRCLTEAPVLTIYDATKEHQLHTDASCTGIAAILMQEVEESSWKPVAYFSRACRSAEKNYHAYELEVLAVVEACQRFRMFLLGKYFTVITDCQAISSMKITKPMNPRVARWFLKLLEYDHRVVHRAGSSMRHVDALSRAPGDNDERGLMTDEQTTNVLTLSVDDWVSCMQQQDTKLKNIVDILCDREHSDQKAQLQVQYCIKNHRLFRKSECSQPQLVVPKGMRWRIIKMCHDDVGHPGVDGTIKRTLQHFWFPRLRNFVKSYVKSCVECCYHRTTNRKQGELYGMDIPKVTFQVLHLDHLGPFDALTRYAVVSKDKTSA